VLAPLKQLMLSQFEDEYRPAVGVGVGSTLAFYTGEVRRAPAWMSALASNGCIASHRSRNGYGADTSGRTEGALRLPGDGLSIVQGPDTAPHSPSRPPRP